MGIAPDQALALEDSPNGVRAAKRAGMTCVAVPNMLTRQLDLSEADMCLGSLAEIRLEDLLRKLAG
jgi:beta-phosphoglucomutase-like phosphatase (HAD superfamily)